MKPPISFLPLFLTTVAFAFVGALAWRVHSYANAPAIVTTTTALAETETYATATHSTGTIVELTRGGQQITAPTATVAERKLTRAERFRQLLNLGGSTPPPAPQTTTAASTRATPQTPVAPPPKPQSAISRITQSIANALGGGPSRPAPQPQAQQNTNNGRQQAATADPNDPTSDSTPPQLVSVEFNPPQVHDGDESMLIVTAVDNLSGVRGLSGTITSPSGKALQGFAQQRESPESNRYISKVTIPKDAEEGNWRVNFINISDNASNSVTLSYVQGGVPPNALLKVTSSRSDSTPPTLKNIYMDRRSMHTGEHNQIHVQADDDKSGVHLVAVVFVSPSKFARLGVGCQKGENEIWNCDFSPPACLDCGDWQLEQVQMQDNANNLATVRSENTMIAATRLNIQGDSCDNAPPVLQGLALDHTVVAAGGEVTVTLTVSDDTCGVNGVSGQFTGPGQGSGRFFPFAQQGDSQTWVGHIRLEPLASKGLWRVSNVTVNDKGQNTRVYFANDPLLQNGQFQLR